MIAQTLQRLALEDDQAELDAVSAGDVALPLTESLPRVLLEQTARSLALGPVETAYMLGGRLPIAAFVGFDFALRCVAAVMEHPLADHRESFRNAAFTSAAILGDDLQSGSAPDADGAGEVFERGQRDGDAGPDGSAG